MSGQIHISSPRLPLDLLIRPPYYWVVPCADGEHEILVPVVPSATASRAGSPRYADGAWPASPRALGRIR